MDVIPKNIDCHTEVKSELNDFLIDWFSDKTYINSCTSGSTGKPQEIQLRKEGVQFSAQNTIDYFKLNEYSKALLCLPLTTIGGKMMVIRALMSNMKLVVQKATANPLKDQNQTYDFIAVNPMQLSNMLNHSLNELKQITTILVGGAPIHAQLENRLKTEGIFVYHSYGMTETASHVALRKVGHNESKFYSALIGITFETNEYGNLIIHYPALNTNPIQTNDQVKLLNSYSFEWIGRNDFVINSGGIKVHPEEVESKIADQIAYPFFITGIPDEVLGEKVVLVIESTNSDGFYNFDFLGNHKPREVYFVEKFIYTTSEKIDRKATIKLVLSPNP